MPRLERETTNYVNREVISLEQILAYIRQTYSPSSIILYGSYADGTNNLNSDFDALVISYDHGQFHDTSVIDGVPLDVFVYPVSCFDGAFDCGDFIQIFDGMVILDRDGRGKALQKSVRSYLQTLPQKSKEELDASIAWCVKMLARAKRNDAEGLYRWHWVLTDSLEIFCDVMRHPYFGPKKSLKWMERQHPAAFSIYKKALEDFSLESLDVWIAYIETTNRLSA